MVKALCGHYPCHNICSRVCHCPAGNERVRWYALFDKASRPAPPGVNPETGEMYLKPESIYKLHHMGENHDHVVFSPTHTIAVGPAPQPQSPLLRVAVDRAVSEAGFPINKGNRYSYSNGLINKSVITPVLNALPQGKIFKMVVGCLIAIAIVAVLWCSAVIPESSGNRAQAGHTYNSHGYDITGK